MTPALPILSGVAAGCIMLGILLAGRWVWDRRPHGPAGRGHDWIEWRTREGRLLRRLCPKCGRVERTIWLAGDTPLDWSGHIPRR